jgi:hypothetical protein
VKGVVRNGSCAWQTSRFRVPKTMERGRVMSATCTKLDSRMNKTLISIAELKQIALREIHTYPGCEDVSAVRFCGCRARSTIQCLCDFLSAGFLLC